MKCFGLLDPVLRYSPEGSNCVYYTVAKPERDKFLRHSRLGKPPVDSTARSAKEAVSPLEAQVLPHRPFACWDYYFPCPLNYEWSLITLDLCRLVESVASGKQQASHTLLFLSFFIIRGKKIKLYIPTFFLRDIDT